jgi:trk system potassium uptake protein TrkH
MLVFLMPVNYILCFENERAGQAPIRRPSAMNMIKHALKIGDSFSPVQKVLFSFIALILAGSALLMLPCSTVRGISCIDSLFTSTSAVCVTGLVVMDTAADFTLFGKIVILSLIQLGGFGIMTFSMGLLAMFSESLSIRWRFTFQDLYSDVKKIPIKSLLKRIVYYTFIIEFAGAILLFTQFYGAYGFSAACGHAVFHSVSAFCNAGFSTFSDSLMSYNGNAVVILTISANIVLGGLGFIVLYEFRRVVAGKIVHREKRFSLHSKFVLFLTAILIAAGAVGIASMEWEHGFSTMTLKQKVLASILQSVTCRTAGFNSVDIGSLRQTTLLVMIVLMFIGGSPGSIAGGVKTTTFGVMVSMIIAKFRGASQVVLWKRGLDRDTIEKSMLLILLAMSFILASTFALLTLNGFDLRVSALSAGFEVVSAFGTVGLSMGVTGQLSFAGKLLICVVMYVGRLGPLTLIAAMTSNRKDVIIEYPEEHVMIG